MPPCKLSDKIVEEIYKRALAGEKIMPLAEEFGVNSGPLYSLLLRRYNFKSPKQREATLKLPDAPTDLAYIAAIVDGEGSITTDRNQPVVKVKMTHEGLIDWLSGFGGSRSDYKREGGNTRLYVYGWTVHRQADVLLFLKALLPFLKIKKAKAMDVINQLEIHLKATTS